MTDRNERSKSASEPIVLVEGAQVGLSSDGMGYRKPVLSYLRSLNPKDIDFIEVLKGDEAANYGVRGSNGVILINLLNRRRDYSPVIITRRCFI
jgi:TonB-dependent SusC/RagA subfamily outer membrane receptor